MKKLKTTGDYPCQWDDLIDEKRRTYATIYTLSNVKKGSRPKLKGIQKSKDGIFDIVVDEQELIKENVETALKDLTKITGIEYILK